MLKKSREGSVSLHQSPLTRVTTKHGKVCMRLGLCAYDISYPHRFHLPCNPPSTGFPVTNLRPAHMRNPAGGRLPATMLEKFRQTLLLHRQKVLAQNDDVSLSREQCIRDEAGLTAAPRRRFRTVDQQPSGHSALPVAGRFLLHSRPDDIEESPSKSVSETTLPLSYPSKSRAAPALIFDRLPPESNVGHPLMPPRKWAPKNIYSATFTSYRFL